MCQPCELGQLAWAPPISNFSSISGAPPLPDHYKDASNSGAARLVRRPALHGGQGCVSQNRHCGLGLAALAQMYSGPAKVPPQQLANTLGLATLGLVSSRGCGHLGTAAPSRVPKSQLQLNCWGFVCDLASGDSLHFLIYASFTKISLLFLYNGASVLLQRNSWAWVLHKDRTVFFPGLQG